MNEVGRMPNPKATKPIRSRTDSAKPRRPKPVEFARALREVAADLNARVEAIERGRVPTRQPTESDRQAFREFLIRSAVFEATTEAGRIIGRAADAGLIDSPAVRAVRTAKPDALVPSRERAIFAAAAAGVRFADSSPPTASRVAPTGEALVNRSGDAGTSPAGSTETTLPAALAESDPGWSLAELAGRLGEAEATRRAIVRVADMLKAANGERRRGVRARRERCTVPTKQESRAMELHSQGFTYSQIAHEMRVTKSRVGQLLRAGHARTTPASRSVSARRRLPTNAPHRGQE